MKFKFLTIILVVTAIFFQTGAALSAPRKGNVPTSFVYQAITKYKNRNYTGCIQDMDYAISHGKATDIAYYYRALSYAQLGMREEAKQSYEQAAQVTANSTLADYARMAVGCIDDASACDSNLDDSDITKFIRSNEFMHQDVKNAMKQEAMDRIKQNINSEAAPSEKDLELINQNTQPTDKEIADAVRTFQKLGINPYAMAGNPAINAYNNPNSDIAQLNALLNNQNNGNYNNNNMMNLIPMMTAMQSSPNGTNNVNKEFVQAYMLNQMLPNFNFGKNDK